jgi:hypothetical protein
MASSGGDYLVPAMARRLCPPEAVELEVGSERTGRFSECHVNSLHLVGYLVEIKWITC